jgi:hypothetical protein
MKRWFLVCFCLFVISVCTYMCVCMYVRLDGSTDYIHVPDSRGFPSWVSACCIWTPVYYAVLDFVFKVTYSRSVAWEKLCEISLAPTSYLFRFMRIYMHLLCSQERIFLNTARLRLKAQFPNAWIGRERRIPWSPSTHLDPLGLYGVT